MALHAEKSIYITLLVLIGANWYLSWNYGLLLMLLYFIIRLGGKLMGAYLATHIFRPKYEVPPHLGVGLISEGGLAIAIIIDFELLYPSVLADWFITTIVFSVLLSELIGPRLILSLFANKD